MLDRIKKALPRKRLLHYTDIFLAAFGGSLLFDKEHILNAHGLNAWKSLLFAAAVAGGKAAFEAYRNSGGAANSAGPSTEQGKPAA